jgi:hypothetical protein
LARTKSSCAEEFVSTQLADLFDEEWDIAKVATIGMCASCLGVSRNGDLEAGGFYAYVHSAAA